MILEDREIEQIISVKKPVLLIDVAVWETGTQMISTELFLKRDLFFFEKHFGVMPGTYLVEMLAQSSALLQMLNYNLDTVPIISGINGTRFVREVKPEDMLRAEVFIKKTVTPFITSSCKIKSANAGKLICKAEIVHVVDNL